MGDPRRDRLIAEARARLGVPYGLPPGPGQFDCSSFVLAVYQAAGVPFRGVRTAEQIRQACTPIGWADVLPGDLLFFIETYDDPEPPGPDGQTATHIGISLGAGTHKMLNAVEPVSKESDITTEYWQAHLLEAKRAPQLVGGAVPTDLPRGVDVASYQGNPDWAAVAASGIAFAWTKATESANYTNPTFARNWAEIKAHGMARGAYHFARPDANSPEAEAEYFIGAVMAQGLETGDLLALDLEDGSGDLSSWTVRFLQHVRLLVGFDSLVYTSAGFAAAHNLASRPEIGSYGLWLASWQASMPAAPAPWSLVAFWQYTDSETVPGISGAVDGDRFNGSADRIHLYGKPGTVPPPPPPPPDPNPITRSDLDAVIASLQALRERVPV